MQRTQSPATFDLQLFAKTVDKAKILTGESIDELSVVFRTGPDGKPWGPRNSEARILGLKAGAVDADGKKLNWFASALEAVRKGWLINDGVPDNIDGDGDGAEDYEQIYGLLTSAYYDLSSAVMINDSGARSSALCTVIDNFLANLDDVRSGGEGDVRKAGARHSAADSEHIAAIGDAAQKAADAAKESAETIKGHVDALTTKPEAKTDDGIGDDDATKAGATTPPATPPAEVVVPIVAQIDPGIIEATKAAIAEATTEIRSMLETQNASVTKALSDHSTAIDAKLDAKVGEIATKAAESETAVSAIKASVNAIVGAARQATAPGGLTTLEPDGTRKGAAALEAGDAPALPTILPTDEATGENGAIRKLLRAQSGTGFVTR